MMRGARPLLAMAAWILLTGSSWSAHQAAQAGEKALAAGDPAAAVEHFSRAAEADPSTISRYNLGTALLAAGEAQRAAGVLAGVADDDTTGERLADAAHNLGNALLAGSEKASDAEQSRQMLKSAIDAYRTAISADPDADDARTNLQLASLRLNQPDPRPEQKSEQESGQDQQSGPDGQQGQQGEKQSGEPAESSQQQSGSQGDGEEQSADRQRAGGGERGDETDGSEPAPGEDSSDTDTAEPGEDEQQGADAAGKIDGEAENGDGSENAVAIMPADEVARILEGLQASEPGVLRDVIRRATGPGKATERDW